eukprot:gene11280-15132_t
MQNDQYYTLFLGDLSAFCMDEDILEAFSPHGNIAEIKIMKSKKTGLGLGYGFVRYLTELEANNAMKAMQNIPVKGRKLKISWSTDSNSADSKVTSTPTVNGIEAVVYCKFNSVERINFMIDEAYLEELFSSSDGEVVCVKIKQHSRNNTTGKQSGYGFIHFNSDEKGVADALQVIETCQTMVIAGVKYSCTPSRSFRTYLASIGHPLGSVNKSPQTNNDDRTSSNKFINNNQQYSNNGSNSIRENVTQYYMEPNKKNHTTKVKNFSNRNINSGQKQVIDQKGNNEINFNPYKYFDRKVCNTNSNFLSIVPSEREYFHGNNTLQSAPVSHPQSIITENTKYLQHSNDLSFYSPSNDLSYPSTSALTSSQSNDQFSLVSSSMSSNSRSLSLLPTHRHDSHTDRSTTSSIYTNFVDNRPNYGPNNNPNSNSTYFSVVDNLSKFGLG